MKNREKKTRRLSRKTLIRGTRGAISILLCLVLTPFVSVTLGLVEYARYQQVVALCDEVYELTGMSLLTDYDPYLQERFGLLATNQQGDLGTDGVQLLEENMQLLGSQVTLGNPSVQGTLALSNEAMLRRQVVDVSEMTATTALLAKDLKLEELLDKLAELQGVGNFLGTVESLAGLSDALRAAVEKLEALQQAANALNTRVAEIKATTTTLSVDMADFYQKLYDQGLALPADATQEEIDAALEQFQQSYQKEYTDRIRTGKTLYEQLQGVPDLLVDTKKAAEEYIKAVEAAQKAAEKLMPTNDVDKDGSISQAATTALQRVLNEMVGLVKGALSDLTDEAIQAGADAVKQITDYALGEVGLKNVVNRYQQIASGTYFTTPLGSVAKADLTAFLKNVHTLCQAEGPEALAGHIESILILELQFDINGLTEKISEILAYAAGELLNDSTNRVGQLLTDLVKLVKGLFNLDTFYDPDLDSFVKTPEGSYSPYQSFLEALSSLLDAGDRLGSSLAKEGVPGLLDAIKAMVDMFRSIVNIMGALIGIVGESLKSIASIIGDFWNGNTRGLYERLLISGYMRHNLPCRLDADTILDGKEGDSVSLTGFSYADLPKLPPKGPIGEAASGFIALGKFLAGLQNGGQGDDPIFEGAHLEYIRAGTNSEIANQAITFFDLYFLRLLLDLPTVFKDAEVKGLAASATIASWLVYVLYVMAEPYCDTVLLVNGVDVPFVKGKCWLVPTNLVEFTKKMMDAGLGEPLKEDFDKLMKEEGFGNNADGGDDWKDASYQTHVLVLLLIFVKPDTQIERLGNLIEMEATEYYRQQGQSFKMSETYTAVSISAQADLKTLLDVGLAAGGDPLQPSFDLKQTISY